MLKRCLSFAILFSFISLLASPAIAKAKGTWEDVKNLVGHQIAVKDKSGRVTYGILRAADNILIKLQKAEKKSMTNTESSIPRVHVKKVWRATLFVTRRKTGKDALIGAGVGIGAGLVQSHDTKGDGQASIVVPQLLVVGAGVGGIIGFFSKKKHGKGKLVYRRN